MIVSKEFEVKVTSVEVQGMKAAVLKPIENLPTVEKKEVVPFDKNLCSSFYDTYQSQQFALRDPMIEYILKHANHRVLRKLFASCKYFFAKRRTPICYSLVKNNETTKFDDENLTLGFLADPYLLLKNTYVTGNLFVEMRISDIHLDQSFVSNLIPRLYRCEAKHIYLLNQNLSFKELLFLIEHGGVVDFYTDLCEIVDENGKDVDLEEYMKYLLKIEKLELCPTYVSANTGHALAQLKFKSKITFISFTDIHGYPFDVKEFIKFCDAIRGEGICMDMVFDGDFDDVLFVESFKEIMRNYQNNTNNGSFNISRIGDDYDSDADDSDDD